MPNPIARTISVEAAAGDVTFNLELDNNAAAAPTSFTSGLQTAANLISAAIQIPITVNLEIGYNENPKDNHSEPSGGADTYVGYTVPDSYQQLRSLLLSNGSSAVDAAVNALPNATSLNGQTTFQVASAEAKVWGQISPTNANIDGYVGFSSNISSSELVGVALHEFTHALGRVPGVSVLSLFRYTGVGQHDFDPNRPTGPSYFSTDGGNTDLADFGQTSDPSDFLNAPNSNRSPTDPFDEFYGSSTTQSLTSLDLTVLAMLGFSGTVSPTGDDYANSLTDTTHPFGQVSAGGSATGTLETVGDRDWFAIQLSAGISYTVSLLGQHSGGGTLSDPNLRLHDGTGALLAQDDDIATGTNPDSQLVYQPATTGTYYIEAGAHNDALTGTYSVSVATAVADDYANSLTDTTHPFGQVSVGGTATGTLEVAGDRDWFRVQLVAGSTYTVDLLGQQSAAGTLSDPYLRLHDATGALLAQDDDIVSTVDLDSQVVYKATASGTYYIEAGSFADASTGTYRISVDTGLTSIVEASGAAFSTHGTALFSGSKLNDAWSGTVTTTISGSTDTWNALSGTMAEEIASGTNLSGSSSVFTDPTLLGLGAPYADGGLAVSGSGPAAAAETISYSFAAPVAAGNSFILWAPGATINSETGPFTFTFSASLNGSAVSTSGWSFNLRSPFGAALPGNFTINAQTGAVTITNYNSNPFAAVVATPNVAIDRISVAAQTIENDLWGLAFSNTSNGNLIILDGTPQTVFGGAGDTIVGGSGTAVVNAVAGGVSVTGGSGAMSVFGGAGDTVSGGSGPLYVDGTSGGMAIAAGSTGGSDIIVGSTARASGVGTDTLTGGAATVLIQGLGQGDIVNFAAQTGDAFVNATAGNIPVTLGGGFAAVYGGNGDTITMATGNQLATDFAGGATIKVGSAGTDSVIGSVARGSGIGATTVSGGAANVIVQGLGSGDIVNFASQTGTAAINALSGNDAITLGTGAATVFAGAGSTVNFGTGNQYAQGLAGGVAFNEGASGSDTIIGSSFRATGAPVDTLNGGGAAVLIQGLGNGDIVNFAKQTGAAAINATAGSNTVTLGSGVASVFGGAGDTITLGTGNQYVDSSAAPGALIKLGSGGADTVVGSASAGAAVTIKGGAASLLYTPGSGNDLVDLTGSTSVAVINGLGPDTSVINDTIIAGNGGTTVFGGSGNRIGVGANASGTDQFLHSTTIAGGAVGYGTSGSVANSSSAKVTVSNFAETAGNATDFIFYQNETGGTNTSIVTASTQVTIGGHASTVFTLPDGTVMTLAGVAKADFNTGFFKT